MNTKGVDKLCIKVSNIKKKNLQPFGDFVYKIATYS